MNMGEIKWKVPTLTGLLGVVLGISIGYMLYHPAKVVESYKPAVVLSNGAVALERKPDLPPPAPIKKATKELGGKLVRAGTVVLKPEPVEGSSPDCKCKEIQLDFGIVDEGDGQRTVLHTDDATIIGGTDSPQVPYTKAAEPKWEVGVLTSIESKPKFGGIVTRKVGAFSVGIAAVPVPKQGLAAFAVVSLRF